MEYVKNRACNVVDGSPSSGQVVHCEGDGFMIAFDKA